MKNFNDIYEKIYRENADMLESMRKKAISEVICMTIIAFILLLLLSIIKKIIGGIGVIISIILISGLIYRFFPRRIKQYTIMFKRKVIKNLINEYSENLEYHPASGILEMTYNQAKFEFYEMYHSEDLITGMLEGGYKINMAEVKTETTSTDSDGETIITTVFQGLFAEIELNKMIYSCIRIRKDGMNLFDKKDKIEMDSGEFENKFNVYATDKIIAMQLLTSDIMQMLLDFKEKNKITPEITIEGYKFYIRFNTGGVFETTLISHALDYGMLKRYYDIINFTLDLTEKFLKNINETEV